MREERVEFCGCGPSVGGRSLVGEGFAIGQSPTVHCGGGGGREREKTERGGGGGQKRREEKRRERERERERNTDKREERK